MVNIDGSVALVTGAASGLGRAAATRLRAAGAKLVLVDTDRDGGKELADAGVGTFVPADVTSEAEAQQAVGQATALGPLRVLVNCAGVGWGARIVDKDGAPHDLGLFRQIIDINLVGTFNMLRLAAVAMAADDPAEAGERAAGAEQAAAAERGVIINTASIAAYEGQVGQAAYAASKAGIAGLTLAAARDSGVTRYPGGLDCPWVVRDPHARPGARGHTAVARSRDGLTAPVRRDTRVRLADPGDRAQHLPER